jgi:23S rRNA (adenine2503-C2)-methyltransferase
MDLTPNHSILSNSLNSIANPLLSQFSLSELKVFNQAQGFPAFSAEQIYDWFFKRLETEPARWTNVSKKAKEFFQEQMDLSLPQVIWQGLSKDGTRKFLIRFKDGKTVETVAISARNRLTACLSTQVGCAIGCTFCHTGTQGFTRHLQANEIVGQFLAVQKWLKEFGQESERLTNIVYMGQGEPLHNFDNVKKATEIFMEAKGIGLGQRKITLSTSGLCPQIEKLADFPPVNIAISLHAAHDNIRSELMPINKIYDLKRLLKAIKTIPLKAHRRITYEYLLIKDLNDRQADLDALCLLLNKKESKVNLIPFNEYPDSKFKRPDQEKILWFNGELNRLGLTCTIRTTKGDDILAACGQLISRYESKNKVGVNRIVDPENSMML